MIVSAEPVAAKTTEPARERPEPRGDQREAFAAAVRAKSGETVPRDGRAGAAETAPRQGGRAQAEGAGRGGRAQVEGDRRDGAKAGRRPLEKDGDPAAMPAFAAALGGARDERASGPEAGERGGTEGLSGTPPGPLHGAEAAAPPPVRGDTADAVAFAALMERLGGDGAGEGERALQVALSGGPAAGVEVRRGADGQLSVAIDPARGAAALQGAVADLRRRLAERGLPVSEVRLREADGRERGTRADGVLRGV